MDRVDWRAWLPTVIGGSRGRGAYGPEGIGIVPLHHTAPTRGVALSPLRNHTDCYIRCTECLTYTTSLTKANLNHMLKAS